MSHEIWKTILDYPEYEVSNYGNIRSIDRKFVDSWGRTYHKKGQLIKLEIQITKTGYKQIMVHISSNKKSYRLIVARLVAKAFIPNPNNLPQVNHIDENSLNNRVDNLEWCTCVYNINYGDNIKRRSTTKKRKIDVFDINGNFIETMPSGKETSEKYRVSRGSVSSVCNGYRHSVKGMIFKFHSALH